MLVLQVFSGFVSSNRKDAKIKGWKFLPYFFKYSAFSRIPWVKYFFVLWGLYNEAAPQSFVFIKSTSPPPMTHWNESDFRFRLSLFKKEIFGFRPVEFREFAIFGKNVFRIQTSNKLCFWKPLKYFVKGRLIKMIVMVMAHQNEVYPWELADLTSRRPKSFGPYILVRRSSICKDRVNNNVELLSNRNDCCWMPNPSIHNLVLKSLEFRLIHWKFLLQFNWVAGPALVFFHSFPFKESPCCGQWICIHKTILYLRKSQLKCAVFFFWAWSIIFPRLFIFHLLWLPFFV